MNPSRPCHDPHRIDAVLACMADALCDLASAAWDEDGPVHRGEEWRALAEAVESSVDRVALLGLLPLTGRDAAEGEGLARIATGTIKVSNYASDDQALAAVVAVRLATVAASTVARNGKPDAGASALWAAAGRLTGLLTSAEAGLSIAEECMRSQVVDISRLEIERDELRRELEQVRADATDLRTDADAAHAKATRLQKCADALRIERDARAAENEGLRAELDSVRRSLTKAEEVVAELRRQIFYGECCDGDGPLG